MSPAITSLSTDAKPPALLGRRRRWIAACVGVYAAAAMGWVLMAAWLSPQPPTASGLWTAAMLVMGSAAALGMLLRHTARRVGQHLQRSTESESRLKHLLGSLDGAAWFASPDGRLLHYVSPKFQQLYGHAPTAESGMPGRWHDRIHPGDLAAVESALAQLQRDGSVSVRYRIVRPDGEQRWVDDWTHLIRDDAGEVIGLGGVMQDITEQRELQRRHDQAHQRLEAIVESAMDAIITVDSWQRIVLFNAAAAKLLGVAAGAAIGQPLDRFIPAKYRGSHARHVARFAQDGTTVRSMGHLTTLTALRADGTELPVEAAISRAGQGADALMTVVMRDAGPQRAAEQARLAQVQAEAANSAKTRFLSRVSHELRTPLNAVVGLAQVVLGDARAPLTPEQQRHVQHIEDAGWHLLALINDTLDLSKIESGQLNVALEDVDVDGVVAQACAMCQTLAGKHRVEVVHEPCADRTVRARADLLRLRQAVINLLSNAIKYNVPGGRVTLRLGVEAPDVVLRVEDTGSGMSDEQLAHLFEPFNRLGRDHSGIEGVGIGLVVTRGLVDLMNGSLAFDSRIGQGTTAVLRLPRALPLAEPDPAGY